MTKGGNNGKSKMLGRLIFGEKRKQHASPSRHRSSTRNASNVTDAKSSSGGGNSAINKDPINIHDWAIWRMHLNEQMGNEMADQMDFKQIRQFLQSNPFYQQHSRDPSNGRYNGVRLLFSIPHAKVQPELNDESKGALNKKSQADVGETIAYDQNKAHSNIDYQSTAGINPVSSGPPMLIDKAITQFLPKNLIGNTDGFLPVNEQMIATDAGRTRRSMRTSYTASDRVHSTLQKAVKDGNVLEKIKAFEMQAAAVQAELTPKLSRARAGSNNRINNRMQTVTSSFQSTAPRTLSPVMARPIQHHPISPKPMQHPISPRPMQHPISPTPMQHPISPVPIQHESQQQQQQYIRSHRSRHVHPVQHRRDGQLGPMVGRESRKGAHVLEPAHGDIILKRRTPSQKTVNDEDYSMTVMSSMALTTSQGNHHRQHHHHNRASASRSRHRHDTVHEKRSSSHHDHVHKKHAHKPKETTTPRTTATSPNKTSTRYRWLIGRKETSTGGNDKQDPTTTTTKSSKTDKNKKKNNEKEKHESSKKATSPDSKEKTRSPSDNNRVYDVPKAIINDQTKSEPISSQPPSRIEEENESDQEENHIVNKTNGSPPPKEEETIIEDQECETIITTNVERRLNGIKNHQRLPSADGEIISKIEDDTRFSRPTDDHAHRSELNDEDDEYKSEGDVFIEESPVINVIQHYANQCSNEGISSDRRWQWSKESGGLIEKGNRKKKQQQQKPIIILTRENEQEQVVYEIPQSEQISTSKFDKTESNNSKQIHQISKNINQEQTMTDDFFENGPYTNPEVTLANKTSSA